MWVEGAATSAHAFNRHRDIALGLRTCNSDRARCASKVFGAQSDGPTVDPFCSGERQGALAAPCPGTHGKQPPCAAGRGNRAQRDASNSQRAIADAISSSSCA